MNILLPDSLFTGPLFPPLYNTMNTTPLPDNSLRDRNAVVPLPPSKIIDVPPRGCAPSVNDGLQLTLPADLKQSGKIESWLCERYADLEAEMVRGKVGEAVKELNDRLHERTQAFLARERQLLDEVRLLRTILTDGLFTEVDYLENKITYTTRDHRVVGVHDFTHGWDTTLPFQGVIKLRPRDDH